MKKHILGILILGAAFTVALFPSPIRFEEKGTGHGIVEDGGGFYWFHSFKSMYFIDLSHESEQYETPEKAEEVFQNRLEESEVEDVLSRLILERNEKRAVIHFQKNNRLQGYCIFRVKANYLRSICSTSLWHVLEFEKQNYQD